MTSKELGVKRSQFSYFRAGEIRNLIASRQTTASEVLAATSSDIRHFDQVPGGVNSVLCVSEEIERLIAMSEAASGKVGGSQVLAGVPVLVKDNIDTHDMATTAGSKILAHVPPPTRDATVVQRLRAAGALIVGKSNLSEWSNLRSSHSISGWSAVGGQTRNPFALDRSPGGSSSGSGAAVASGLVPLALGTETDGSVVCPAALNGVVGIKPTVGTTSRRGVIPISNSQDSVGVLARTVSEARTMLRVISGFDPEDPGSVSGNLREQKDLRNLRVGVPRQGFFGYAPKADVLVESAIEALGVLGVSVVDECDSSARYPLVVDEELELQVLVTEMHHYLELYLRTRPGLPLQSVAELIRANTELAGEELAYFGQDLFERSSQSPPVTDLEYLRLAAELKNSAQSAIDSLCIERALDAFIVPTMAPAWKIDPINGDSVSGGGYSLSAVAGYPALTLPVGLVGGLPVGALLFGPAFSEEILCDLGQALEDSLSITAKPTYLSSLESVRQVR